MQKHKIKFNMNNDTVKFISGHCDHIDSSLFERSITLKKSSASTKFERIQILFRKKLLSTKIKKKINIKKVTKII